MAAVVNGHLKTVQELGGFEVWGFAQLLKQYRERTRISQSRLAELSGFDHSYVSRLERGYRMPTRDAVDEFAKAMGLDPTDWDALLVAAGFLPSKLESLFFDEPILMEIFGLLKSTNIPEAVRYNLRQMLQLVVSQAQLAAQGSLNVPGTS